MTSIFCWYFTAAVTRHSSTPRRVISSFRLLRRSFTSASSPKNGTLKEETITVKLQPPSDLLGSSRRYMPNAFITPERAYSEYLVTPNDLNGLWKTKRRSPFDGRTDITVFLRADVEKRAVQIWGSLVRVEKEKQKRRLEGTQAMLPANWKEGDGDSTSPKGSRIRLTVFDDVPLTESEQAQRKRLQGSGRVVGLAIGVDIANVVMKTVAYAFTGSSAIFAEIVHSIADTLNQSILAFGIHQSKRRPDQIHPYGWYNFSYVSSLVSGVGIFFVGACLSWLHGVQALLRPEPLESLQIALVIMAGSLISESVSLTGGVLQIRREAAEAKLSFREFVSRAYDPSVNVILAEDLVAVSGVSVAVCCIGLSHYLNSHIPDAIGSLIIGTMLAGVAGLIVYTNAVILVGKSIPTQRRELIRHELELDRMIRAAHDIKATEMGGRQVRFKAEVDIDGRELTRAYLDRLDVDILRMEMQNAAKTREGIELFMMKHGEAIVDLIGAEIDRVELNLKKKFPEVRHVDLEVL